MSLNSKQNVAKTWQNILRTSQNPTSIKIPLVISLKCQDVELFDIYLAIKAQLISSAASSLLNHKIQGVR